MGDVMPKDVDWYALGLEGLKYLAGPAAGAIVTLIGVWAVAVYNRTKRLRFIAEDWKLQFFVRDSAGGCSYQDHPNSSEHAKFGGIIKFFTRKPSVVALHKLAIEFRHGRRRWGRLIHRSTDLSHGPPRMAGPQITCGKLTELAIPREQWVVENIHTFIDKYDQLRDSTAWFAATTVEGKNRRWLLARLQKKE